MKNNKKYIIEYKIVGRDKRTIKSGSMIVKNKTSPIQAQIALKEYFGRKINTPHEFFVIRCKEDYDVFQGLKDIFGMGD